MAYYYMFYTLQFNLLLLKVTFQLLSSSKGATTFICLPDHAMILPHYPWPSQTSMKDLMMLFRVHFLAALCRWLSHCCIDRDGNISYCQAMTSRASSELPGWWHLLPITGSTGGQPRFQSEWRISSFHWKPPWLGPKPKRHNSLKTFHRRLELPKEWWSNVQWHQEIMTSEDSFIQFPVSYAGLRSCWC